MKKPTEMFKRKLVAVYHKRAQKNQINDYILLLLCAQICYLYLYKLINMKNTIGNIDYYCLIVYSYILYVLWIINLFLLISIHNSNYNKTTIFCPFTKPLLLYYNIFVYFILYTKMLIFIHSQNKSFLQYCSNIEKKGYYFIKKKNTCINILYKLRIKHVFLSV